MDQLTKIQTELQETVKDLAKGKKKYFETEQMAHAVREKADIEAKYVLALVGKWLCKYMLFLPILCFLVIRVIDSFLGYVGFI